MPDKLPISVHILTWNSGKTLRKALQSIHDCAEILIIDGGSTDDTLSIAKEYGAKVIDQRSAEDQGKPLTDFAEARNRGLEATKEPWILTLDSDETFEPGFFDELRKVLADHPAPAAYRVPRRYMLPNGTIVKHASTYPNERIYFFHRDAVSEWKKPVHERVEVKKGFPTKRLRHGTLAPLPSRAEFRRKNRRYLELEIEKAAGQGTGQWLKRIGRATRGQAVSMARLAPIWLLPRRGKRLPLSHELERWRYRWALVKATRPGKHHPKEERTCVVTVADDAFTEYLVVLLSSIQKYNPWFRERLLVLHSQTLSPLSEESKDRILKVYPTAEFRLVDEAPFEKYHKDAPQRLWPALLKLHIFRLAEFDRVIFIDSDILCLGDIHYLWEIPADFAACAAGKDKAAKEREADTIKRGLGLNSGVMVIGKKYLSEKIFQKMLTYKSGPCADQDVLTRFFRFKKVYRLDHRYNYHAQFFWKGENTDDVRLLHYAGEKPLQKPELERMKVWFEHHLPIHA